MKTHLVFAAAVLSASSVFAADPTTLPLLSQTKPSTQTAGLLPAQAGTPAAQQQPAPVPTTEIAQPSSLLSFTGGIDFQSKYIFRGFTTTNHGLISQPYGQMAFNIFDELPLP